MTLNPNVMTTYDGLKSCYRLLASLFRTEKMNLAISSLIFLGFFWLVDYYNLFTFKIELLPVDIITYLTESNSTTVMGDFKQVDLRNIIEEVYMRNREWYFDNYQNLTIIVTPIVKCRRNQLSIELMEEFYNLVSRNHIIDHSNMMGYVFKKNMNYHLFKVTDGNISNFVTSYLSSFYDDEYLKNFKHFDTLRYLTGISTIGLLIASTCLTISLASSYCIQHFDYPLAKQICIIILFLSFVAVLGFQLLNFLIVIILNNYYNNLYFVRYILVTLGQLLGSIILSYGYYFHSIDLLLDAWKKRIFQSETERFKEFEKETNHLNIGGRQSDTSSVYSDEFKQKPVNTPTKSGLDPLVVSYSGSIRTPGAPISPLQRNFTAPLPLPSAESDSSGFEPLRRSMSARSPVFNKRIPSSFNQSPKDNFAPIHEIREDKVSIDEKEVNKEDKLDIESKDEAKTVKGAGE